jgi:perosamine synthetase
MHPYYRETYGYGEGLCPEAEAYYAGCVSLPCFPALDRADQERVIEAVRALA